MNARLVGADRLGNIPDVLSEFGIRIASHISGRQPGHQRRALVPAGIQVVILFTDFLGHNGHAHIPRSGAGARAARAVLPPLDEQPAPGDRRRPRKPLTLRQNAIRLAPSKRRVQ